MTTDQMREKGDPGRQAWTIELMRRGVPYEECERMSTIDLAYRLVAAVDGDVYPMHTPTKLVEREFRFGDLPIRTTQVGDQPWFVATDIMDALEYAPSFHPSKATKHIPAEWKGVYPIHTPGGKQYVLCLNEPGLYFFLGRSDKPKALPFQKWVAGEVLPSIRKTGAYAARQMPPSTYRVLPELAVWDGLTPVVASVAVVAATMKLGAEATQAMQLRVIEHISGVDLSGVKGVTP